jgi:hypothetical protein
LKSVGPTGGVPGNLGLRGRGDEAIRYIRRFVFVSQQGWRIAAGRQCCQQ